MELIEIIRTTLIIFTLLSSVYFSISYGIYKYRNRKNVKPYLKNYDSGSPEVVLKKESEIEQVKSKPAKIKRFHILNENIENHPMIPSLTKALPVYKLRQQPVISYYSFNKKDSLRKLQTSVYTD